MKIRSLLLVLLTSIMSCITTKAYVIDKPDGGGWGPVVATNVEYAKWREGGSANAVPDTKLPAKVDLPTVQMGGPVSTEAWEQEWNVPLPAGATPEDVLKSINDIWAREKTWTRVSQRRVECSDTSVWQFIDQTGNHWIATARIEPSLTSGRVRSVVISLKIVGASTSDTRLAEGKRLL